MDNEVRQLAGEHFQLRHDELPYSWGREQGFLVVDGQKVPIQLADGFAAGTAATNNL